MYHNSGIFKHDDLINIITIDRPCGTHGLKIVRDIVQINRNPRLVFIEENPIYPYRITIPKDKSQYLQKYNKARQKIVYEITKDGKKQLVETTLNGELEFIVNEEAVRSSDK